MKEDTVTNNISKKNLVKNFNSLFYFIMILKYLLKRLLELQN